MYFMNPLLALMPIFYGICNPSCLSIYTIKKGRVNMCETPKKPYANYT